MTQVDAKGFDLDRERVSSQCVCCGGRKLKSSPAILMPFIAHRVFGWAPVVIDEGWGLSTIQNGHAYSLCKSLYCPECGFLFLDIRFSDAELARLYKDYRGDEYIRLRETYEPGYAQRNAALNDGVEYLAEIENFLRPYLGHPLTILDWGGDTGKNTPFRGEVAAFDIYDISNKDVVQGGRLVSRNEAMSKKYSLIVCSNVLEHVPYPSDLLKDIVRTMDTGSILYLEVPFEDVMVSGKEDLHLSKRHWHEHINFYSENSIRHLVQSVGLDVIDLKILNATAGGRSSYLFQVACKIN